MPRALSRMANIKQQKKRVQIASRQRLENLRYRSTIKTLFKRLETAVADGDEAALKNWRVWREMSVKKYEQEYERLNVHFDVYTGESKVGKKSMDDALVQLESMGLISDTDGAKLVELDKWKLGKAVVRKKGAYPFHRSRQSSV